MKLFLSSLLFAISTLSIQAYAASDYNRNQAVPVEKVLFGHVMSIRYITQQDLIEDKDHGWKVFGGAVLGGVLGHQFGSGSGRDIATILGALIGGTFVNNNNTSSKMSKVELIELMVKTDTGQEYMVIQYLDPSMIFHRSDKIRMVYLTNGIVRVDKEM